MSEQFHNLIEKYHHVGTVPKSNRQIKETEQKLILMTHIDMTTYLPGLDQHSNKKWRC